MMRRRIFLWMGLGVLFVSSGFLGEALARETYRVVKGDTLFAIAEKTGVTVPSLKAANNLKGNNLKLGQTLVIPTPKTAAAEKSRPASAKTATAAKTKPSSASSDERTYRVAKGDTIARVAKKTGVSVTELCEINSLPGSALKVGQRLLLTQKPDRAGSPEETLRDLALADDEEEEDGGITSETAWAEVERRKKESAELLGNWTSPEEPKLLVRVAMGFLGAPYRLGGSSVKGLDCSAFVKKIYQIFNTDLPRTAFEQSHLGMRVARDELTEGDLLFFNTRRRLGHVGIYIGNNEFVHASSRKRGVRVDNLDTPYFDKRFVRAVRIKGSDEGL